MALDLYLPDRIANMERVLQHRFQEARKCEKIGNDPRNTFARIADILLGEFQRLGDVEARKCRYIKSGRVVEKPGEWGDFEVLAGMKNNE